MTTRVQPDRRAAAVAHTAPRRDKGRRAWLSGVHAEMAAADAYARGRAQVLEARWRGQGGEIDLILRAGATYVFCEVKKAPDPDTACARLRPAQVRRLHAAAAEYLGGRPEGQLADCRFDLAAVDAAGRVEIRENAFGHF
jgi:putative endonuclease